ncbi:thiosulfate sulfurtransferase/rhodanese-like domain-containing protein 3 isoform X1 [Pieris rapae]|uniref:thiosulfate sulfurtransferase/rhodanese-like domain-containing protein 3 isoform X1 n=2 Tax=Pieris rapae TaxID=64459 RepID=UPI001E27F8C1|nr:thiosulfate sulfurtransferase/rhodanese-like domain-containing protein 3 isoform X1 [Pieris rapae]
MESLRSINALFAIGIVCMANLSPLHLVCSKINDSTMVDPVRFVSYEDMLKVIHEPEKVIIDVRNPDEIESTGKIPSSLNIPLNTVSDTLASMPDDEFLKQYQRPKPSASDELIFYCKSGRRSQEALDKALKLGFSNSKSYLGSWEDWSSKQK